MELFGTGQKVVQGSDGVFDAGVIGGFDKAVGLWLCAYRTVPLTVPGQRDMVNGAGNLQLDKGETEG